MEQTNIIKVKINELVNQLLPIYTYGAQQNDFSKITPIMLWGPPGVGKSDMRKTLAKELEKQTGKKVYTRDVRLLLFNPVDLRGVPVPSTRDVFIDINDFNPAVHEKSNIEAPEGKIAIKEQFAVWLKPYIFQLDPSDDVINIILLDEISAAPPSVQAAAYQLTLDRCVGEHKLPNNTIIMAAGNRVTDKGVAYKMPTPLANRLTHFEITPELEDWKEWAIPNKIDERIIGFLNYRPNYLFQFDPTKDSVAFATPRSWSFVDTYLKAYKTVEAAYYMIAGSVGLGVATEFKAYCEVADKIPNVMDILEGKDVPVPKGADVLYALSASLVAKASSADQNKLRNIVKYTMKMPKEFSVLTMKDLLRVELADGTPIKKALFGIPEWVEWCSEHREYIA